MKTRISYIEEDGMVVEPSKINPVVDNQGYILRKSFPFVLGIENVGWINPNNYNHKEMIINWRGSYQEYSPEDFIPLVRLSTLLDVPEQGRDFYGLVTFLDTATPSDYFKGKNILGGLYQTTDENLIIIESGLVPMKVYYHSFPISKVMEFDGLLGLERICRSQKIKDESKFQLVKNIIESNLITN